MTKEKLWVPNRVEHLNRNHNNIRPFYDLQVISKDRYTDNVNIWQKIPWYFNIFHNPIKNIKLLLYHDNNSSSEIIVARNKVGNGAILLDFTKDGSFNYRDFTTAGHIKHFFADILPYILYGRPREYLE